MSNGIDASSLRSNDKTAVLPSCSAVIGCTEELMQRYYDAVSKLPVGEDYEYNSVFPDFPKQMQENIDGIEDVVKVCIGAHVNVERQKRLLRNIQPSQLYPAGMGCGGKPVTEEVLTRRHQRNMEIVDFLFENVQTLMDELAGLKMNSEEQMAAFVAPLTHTKSSPKKQEGTQAGITDVASAAPQQQQEQQQQQQRAVISRPQLFFKRKVDNSHDPFRPLLFDYKNTDVYRQLYCSGSKPDPIDVLIEKITTNTSEGTKTVIPEVSAVDDTIKNLRYGVVGANPYAEMIKNFSFGSHQLRLREEQIYLPVEDDNLSFITTVEELESFILSFFSAQYKELAIDLEHHDRHSYQGFTCLMQLSTRDGDFLVDVFSLRDELYRLNIIFLNPDIVKVLHGCNEDVRWMQKDFGLFLCNVFDTAVALRCLFMPYSLYSAVDHFCSVKLDKQYQTADWRQRPLSDEMIHYARLDTHYLLYIYDRLTNLLLQQENSSGAEESDTRTGAEARRVAVGAAMGGTLLVRALDESKHLCLSHYEKPVFDAHGSFRAGLSGRSGVLTLCGWASGAAGGLAEALARAVFNWRDKIAREEDESPAAIMQNSSIVTIACTPLCPSSTGSKTEDTTLQRLKTVSPTELFKLIHPLSVFVRKHIRELVQTIDETLLNNSSLLEQVSNETHLDKAAASAEVANFKQDTEVIHVERYEPMRGLLFSSASFEPVTSVADVSPSDAMVANDGKMGVDQEEGESPMSPLFAQQHTLAHPDTFTRMMCSIANGNKNSFLKVQSRFLGLIQPPHVTLPIQVVRESAIASPEPLTAAASVAEKNTPDTEAVCSLAPVMGFKRERPAEKVKEEEPLHEASTEEDKNQQPISLKQKYGSSRKKRRENKKQKLN